VASCSSQRFLNRYTLEVNCGLLQFSEFPKHLWRLSVASCNSQWFLNRYIAEVKCGLLPFTEVPKQIYCRREV
jgi:hypothetical protein